MERYEFRFYDRDDRLIGAAPARVDGYNATNAGDIVLSPPPAYVEVARIGGAVLVRRRLAYRTEWGETIVVPEEGE